MKIGKLAVSLTAAALMGVFGSAYAQTTSTYTTSSEEESAPAVNNTDENAPSSSQDDELLPDAGPSGGTYQTGSASSGRQPAPY